MLEVSTTQFDVSQQVDCRRSPRPIAFGVHALPARRVVRRGTFVRRRGLLTVRQKDRLADLFAADDTVEVEATPAQL